MINKNPKALYIQSFKYQIKRFLKEKLRVFSFMFAVNEFLVLINDKFYAFVTDFCYKFLQKNES